MAAGAPGRADGSFAAHVLPPGGGALGALVRAKDWSATPLGPPEGWPQSLRSATSICLGSAFPICIYWGSELALLYNDEWSPIPGSKHPWALGRPAREVWPEIWETIGPLFERVRATGEAIRMKDQLLAMRRHGYVEECYFDYTFSPIRGERGDVEGIFNAVVETTERVVGERRLRTLRDLASRVAQARTPDDVVPLTTEVLSNDPGDLPFALVYLVSEDGREARLAGAAGVVAGTAASPTRIGLDDDAGSSWPLAQAMRAGAAVLVDGLEARADELPPGPWPERPRQALVLPITGGRQERPLGFLVAGISARRALDDEYRGFLELLAGHVATALVSTTAFAAERRRAAALAELDRAKTTFFSNVSHEFRTPLTLLLAPTEDLLAAPRTATLGDVRESLAVVHRNALRLHKLVNTLLDFARVEAGRAEAHFEPTDVAAYTAELAASFRSAFERAGLSLVVDAPPPPDGLPPAYVDRDMWEKVVLNLLSNAFKHTFEGTIRVAVRSHAGDGVAPPTVMLEVADTGVGIPAEQLPRIFDRFHRVASTRSRTHEGTGIGLALVQELVRQHGGHIAVESAEGRGTTFTVALPLGAAHLPHGHVSAPSGRSPHRSVTLGAAPFVEEALRWLPPEQSGADGRARAHTEARDGAPDGAGDAASSGEVDASTSEGPADGRARIVLADDNADMRDYVARLLREQGWQVEGAPDGATALAAVRRSPPDLVLSDVMMPRLDGFGLLRALRADAATATVPVILLSARAGEEARVEGVSSGADDYLVKPFAAAELVARVRTHLALSRERRRAMAAVAAAEERLRSLIRHAPVAIATTTGPRHVLASVNEAYCRLVARPAGQLVGRTLAEAFPEMDVSGGIARMTQAYTTGEPLHFHELRAPVLREDGRPDHGYFNVVYQPLRGDDGAVHGLALIAFEVTAQVHARREAEQANRAKGDFLAAMSHELRTPLNAIGGYVQLVEMGVHGPITEAQRDVFARVQRSQQHLLSLINDVLNFTKLEAGRVEYELEDVRLVDALADVMTMVEPQIAARGLASHLQVPPRLSVRADREKLQQVLLNLLSNAVKFTSSGSVAVEAAIAADDPSGRVAIRVRDTGIGIPAERLQSVFDPFVQVHRRLTNHTEGTGLGLAISRDLARGMGGELQVASVEGRGSVFTLLLPDAGKAAARDPS